MIILTAAMKAKAGKEQELEAALSALVPETAKEEGVLEYRLHRSEADAGAFLFVEKFRDQGVLDRHMEMPHIKTCFARFDTLLEGPAVVGKYTLLDAIPE